VIVRFIDIGGIDDYHCLNVPRPNVQDLYTLLPRNYTKKKLYLFLHLMLKISGKSDNE
jgi:hypothetical protein